MARFGEDLFVEGDISSLTMGIPDATVTDLMVASAAAIAASKLKHQYLKVFAEESGTTITDKTQVVHVAIGAGEVVSYRAGAITANVGAATTDCELLKNGVTVLNAAAQLTNGQTSRALVTATIGTTAYVAGDVFEIDYDTTAGGGTEAVGVFAEVVLREAAD